MLARKLIIVALLVLQDLSQLAVIHNPVLAAEQTIPDQGWKAVRQRLLKFDLIVEELTGIDRPCPFRADGKCRAPDDWV